MGIRYLLAVGSRRGNAGCGGGHTNITAICPRATANAWGRVIQLPPVTGGSYLLRLGSAYGSVLQSEETDVTAGSDWLPPPLSLTSCPSWFHAPDIAMLSAGGAAAGVSGKDGGSILPNIPSIPC